MNIVRFSLRLTNPELEAVEGVSVDELQFGHEGERKLHHGPNVTAGHLGCLQEEPEVTVQSHSQSGESLTHSIIHSLSLHFRSYISDDGMFLTFLPSPGGECVRPAAAMYVLPIVLIFSTDENLGFESSCVTKTQEEAERERDESLELKEGDAFNHVFPLVPHRSRI